MKPGTRALGVAESTDEDSGRCTLCGAVVRADRAVDGFEFATATVGGLDATDAVGALVDRLDREDVRYLLISGVAPAWFNLIDLRRTAALADRPVLSISYEESSGLESALREQFDGEALESRLSIHERLPPRRRVRANDETLFVRSVGLDGIGGEVDEGREGSDADDEAARIVRAYTPTGGRPEPVRVARLAARGARRWDAAGNGRREGAGDRDRHG